MMLPFFISVIIIYNNNNNNDLWSVFLHGSFTSASAILTKEIAVTYNVTQLNHSKL